jgi:hypothetical protein
MSATEISQPAPSRSDRSAAPSDPTAARLVDILSGCAVQPLSAAEWAGVIGLARRLGVAPLLAHMALDGPNPPPTETASELQTIYRAAKMRAVKLFYERDILLESLTAAGIACAPVKGAHLAEAVYGNIALRRMGDIDIWLPRDQVDAARGVLAGLGYAASSKDSRPQALQDAIMGETQMVKSNATLVELHWSLFAGEWARHTTRIDEAEIWRRCLPFQSDLVRQLTPEDTLIHLCVHFAVNHYTLQAGLRTLLDLDFLRRAWTVDWAEVSRRARAWRVSCAVWLVLRRYSELFGGDLGALPLADLAPSPVRQKLLERLAPAAHLLGDEPPGGAARFLRLLLLVDRKRDAVLLTARAFYPEREWLTLRYGLENAPGWRVWLQRLYHPLRVLLRREI